jgi:hypothetical protein
MKSRSGTKLYAVRDESGKFEDIQTYKRAHTADMRHKSQAEIAAAAKGPVEGRVRKAAKDAVASVKSAVAAVGRAAKRAVKKVSSAQPAGKKTVMDAGTTKANAAGKTTGKPAAKKATKKSAAKPATKKI